MSWARSAGFGGRGRKAPEDRKSEDRKSEDTNDVFRGAFGAAMPARRNHRCRAPNQPRSSPRGAASRGNWPGRLVMAPVWAMVLAIGLAGCAPPGGGLGGGLGGLDRPMADQPAPEASGPAPESRVQPAGPKTVALLLPLSGPKAEQGRALEAAARRVLTTDRAGLFDLRVFDTQASAEGARVAAEGAVAAGADLVLGPLYSVTAQAARPALSAASIPILSFSNNRAVAGDGLYLLGHLPGQQTEALLAHAALHGHGALAVVGPDTAYARLVVDAVRSEARRGSVRFMGSELFPADTDYNSQVTIVRDLARRRPGGVVLPTTGLRLAGLSALFDYYDARPPQVRLMGTDLWEHPGTFAEGSLRGGWYVSASTPPVRDPMAGVRAPTTGDSVPSASGVDTDADTADPDAGTAAAGEDAARADPSASEDAPSRPVIRLSTGAGKLDRLAMDAMALASAWAERAAPGADITAFLTDSAGFRGFSGLFRLLPSGLNDRGLHVLEVTPRGPRLISPAPTMFAPGLTPTMLLRPADFRVHPWLTVEVDPNQVPTVQAGGVAPPMSTVTPAPPATLATPASRAVSPAPSTTAPSSAAPIAPASPNVRDPVTGRWSGGNERWTGAPPAPPVRVPSTVTPVSTGPAGGVTPSAPTSGAGGRVPPAPPLVAPGAMPASTATPTVAPVTRSSDWRPPAPPLTAPSATPGSPPTGGVSGGVPPAPSLAPPPDPALRGACVWQRHCMDGTCRRVQVCPIES